jgi:AsmA protein
VELGGVSLSNAPGFGDQPFAQVEKLDLKVAVLPLLSKRVEVDTVVLKGLGLHLARDAQGRSNWADLAGEPQPEGAPAEAQPGDGAGDGDLAFAVQGIQVEDARVVWDDRQAGQRLVLEDVNLTTGTLEPGADVPVNAGLRLTSDQPQLTLQLGLDGTVAVSGDFQQYIVDDLELRVEAAGEGLPADGVALDLTADLRLDQAAGTLSLQDLSLSGPEVQVTGQLNASGLQTAPAVDASLRLQDTNLRNLLGSFGVVLDTADPAALASVSGELGAKMADGALAIEPLQLKLDDSNLTGQVRVPSFDGPVVRATLTLDEIDLDRYLPPPGTGEAAPQAESSAETAPAGDPFAGIRTLDLDATATIGRLKVNNLRMNDLKAVIKSKGGVLRVDPASARLYDGSFGGLVELDVRQSEPKLRFKEALTGIQIGPLLQDLIGEDRLVGTGEVHADLRMVGLSEAQIRRSLNGTARIVFRDGAYKGINLAQLIREAQARLGQGTAGAAGAGTPQTDFTELTGSAVITNGVIDNQDLRAKSPLLRIDGQGRVNLPQDSLDYRLTTTVVGTLEGQGGRAAEELQGVPIPVRLTGSLQDPKPSVDLESALRAVAEQKVEEKKQEVLEDAQEKVQDEVGKALKGLFGR